MTIEIDTIIKKAESLGWSVEKKGDNEYRFSQFSPYGQDFSFTVEGATAEAIIDGINEYYGDFDVSEETYRWLDCTGHGRNGAPHEMKDVLADMEACEEMVFKLRNQLLLLDLLDFN